MMKRHLVYLFVALCALAVAGVSCSKDESAVVEAEESVVKFSLSLESAMSTKAISDGKSVDQLMYAIFDEDNNLIIKKAVHDNPNGLTSTSGFTTNLTLPNGHTYTGVFWAQNSACKAYTVSDDMRVTIDYTGVNNDETRDAFFAAKTFTVQADETVSVVLKRPFAQINVGAFPFDYEHVVEAKISIVKSSATIKKVPDQINLLDGTVSGEVDVTYTFGTSPLANTPAEDLLVDVDENKEKETYKWLSMSYILADIKERSTTHEMSFKFADENETNVIELSDGLGLGSVPATRNWRTNIVGQILTGSVYINIKIDPIYEGETINSAGLYYNFSQDTQVKDKIFAFNTKEWATFTTENNNLLTLDNVTFSGKIGQIAIGEYRGKTIDDVPYTNVLKNVTAEDMKLLSDMHPNGKYHAISITNVEPLDYMALLFYLRGETTLENCEITGTTSVADKYTDHWGDIHDVLTYDCGFPNYSNALVDNCTIGKLYAWSHIKLTLTNTKVNYIRCSTHNQTEKSSHLTIGEGCEVDEIFVTSSGLAKRKKDENGKTHWVDAEENRWAPSLIIKKGAKVGKIDFNYRGKYDSDGNLDVIIEEGAVVGEIVNLKEE